DGLRHGGERQDEDGGRGAGEAPEVVVRVDETGEEEEDDEERQQPEGPSIVSDHARNGVQRTSPASPEARCAGAHGLFAGTAGVSAAVASIAAATAVASPDAAATTSSGSSAPGLRLCAARRSAASSAAPAGISATTWPPQMTITRSQASWISLSSDVYSRMAAPAAARSRRST